MTGTAAPGHPLREGIVPVPGVDFRKSAARRLAWVSRETNRAGNELFEEVTSHQRRDVTSSGTAR